MCSFNDSRMDGPCISPDLHCLFSFPFKEFPSDACSCFSPSWSPSFNTVIKVLFQPQHSSWKFPFGTFHWPLKFFSKSAFWAVECVALHDCLDSVSLPTSFFQWVWPQFKSHFPWFDPSLQSVVSLSLQTPGLLGWPFYPSTDLSLSTCHCPTRWSTVRARILSYGSSQPHAFPST